MSSKSAKKNAKRLEKKKEKKLVSLVEERKLAEEEEKQVQKADPVEALKQSLAEAKASGDHKLAAKLRQDLWVLQDASSGHSIQLESEAVEESMQRLELVKQKQQAIVKKELTKKSAKEGSSSSGIHDKTSPTPDNAQSSVEKEIKKIKKKLEQIDKLKKMRDEGNKLAPCQIEKMEKEQSFKDQLEQLQEDSSNKR